MDADTRIAAAQRSARSKVPAVLRALKSYHQLRDEDIAAACGMTRSAVQARMAGKTGCTPWELAGFAEFFGVDVSVFYDGPASALGSTGEFTEVGGRRAQSRCTDLASGHPTDRVLALTG